MGAKTVISLSKTHPASIKSKVQDDSEYVSLILRGHIQGQSVAVGKVRDKVTISRAFLKYAHIIIGHVNKVPGGQKIL